MRILSLIFCYVLIFFFLGCSSKPEIIEYCNDIECSVPYAFVEKNGNYADIYISRLKYVNCCNKEPKDFIYKEYVVLKTENKSTRYSNSICKIDLVGLLKDNSDKLMEMGTKILHEARYSFKNKNYSQSLLCFQKSLPISKKIFGNHHFSLGITYRGIAASFYELKNYQDAIKYYRLALNIYNSLDKNKYKDKIQKIKLIISKISYDNKMRKILTSLSILK